MSLPTQAQICTRCDGEGGHMPEGSRAFVVCPQCDGGGYFPPRTFLQRYGVGGAAAVVLGACILAAGVIMLLCAGQYFYWRLTHGG